MVASPNSRLLLVWPLHGVALLLWFLSGCSQQQLTQHQAVFGLLPLGMLLCCWLLLVVFLVNLLRRLKRAAALVENLQQELAIRADANRQQLALAYDRQQQLELLSIAETDRIRIYRDLHDDVGSKLLSIVHGSRASREGRLAAEALESLRNAVARANNPDIPFRRFLDALHDEMRLRLQGIGVHLGWKQPEQNLEWVLNSHQHYQLTRIFRELVSNVLRHASASEVEFSVAQLGEQWQFSLADNGCGFVGEPPKTGLGLRNIREWSLVLDAASQWMSRPQGGVVFTLLLPAP
jgi:signal transduction histidine kinase